MEHGEQDRSVRSGTAGATPAILAVVAAIVISSAIFIAAPALDMAVSRLFYDPETGFAGRLSDPARTLRALGFWMTRLAVAALVLAAIVGLISKPVRAAFGVNRWLYLSITLAIGPGLIISTIMKNTWGRPRPLQIAPFGGEGSYVAPWAFSDQCAKNCSFVSGEAAASFWWVALAFVVPARWRSPVLIVALCYAAAMSLNRVAFGAHFISDIAIAWLITLLVMVLSRPLLTRVPATF